MPYIISIPLYSFWHYTHYFLLDYMAIMYVSKI